MRIWARVFSVVALVGVLFLPWSAPSEAGDDVATSGTYVADLGFRPNVNGFAFENYGSEAAVTNLTSVEMRRIFGDVVCASTAKGKCTLTPEAQEWMAAQNEGMGGGHCEGFAALSLLMFTGRAKPSDFGAASIGALTLDGNQKLQREIALWYATQAADPTQAAEIRDKTPSEILDLLAKGLGSGQTFDMGIYEPGYGGGHAIVPYAVEDRGSGLFWILVYDNNYPNAVRAVEVDRGANTWRYSGSTNPNEPEAEYKGDATTYTLTLTPNEVRLGQHDCNFCNDAAAGRAPGLAAPAARYNEVWNEGDGHLMIVDAQGNRLGLVAGKVVNEIPGAQFGPQKHASPTTWSEQIDPSFRVPVGTAFTVTIDGTGLKKPGKTDIIMVGPGHDLALTGVTVRPGASDTLKLSPDGASLTYQTKDDQSPTIQLGWDGKSADYAFWVKGAAMKGGGTITVALDTAKMQLSVATTGTSAPGTYALGVERIDDQDDLSFSHDGVALTSGDTAFVSFGSWKGGADTIPLGIDHGTKGSIDQTIDLTAD